MYIRHVDGVVCGGCVPLRSELHVTILARGQQPGKPKREHKRLSVMSTLHKGDAVVEVTQTVVGIEVGYDTVAVVDRTGRVCR